MTRPLVLAVAACALAAPLLAQRAPAHGQRPQRLVIRNAIVYEGTGAPAEGPKDIVIEGNRITQIVNIDPVAVKAGNARRPAAGDAEIDAAGKYVLPGLINLHGHVQAERGGIPQPLAYQLKLWLASGITSMRDVGSDFPSTLRLRARSASGEAEAPRLFVYPMFNQMPMPLTPAAARERIREFKQRGADGVKFVGTDRDLLMAALDEARAHGLRTAHHVGVEETTAWDDIAGRTTSIEHWYGVPDAALPDGVQNFPAEYNYNDETHRFRYAGRLWREADPAKLTRVLQGMVDSGVAWNPTLDIYEASRDLVRAQNQPWFADLLHPTLEKYFRPDPANHGSYFIGWTSTDEAFWKENYRIWMAALRQFERLGGVIGVGEDAGFIYQMYGFGLIRELELHQEAGFHPLKVLQHATGNNARILGQEQQLGRLRAGYLADLIVVDGNPFADLKVLYPTGTSTVVDGKEVRSGGIDWTIKDGIPYDARRLLAEVRELVRAAKGGS